jgi:hypothetical protein
MSRGRFGRIAKRVGMPNALRSLHNCSAALRREFAHPDADQGSLERGAGAIPIDIGVARGDTGACPLQSLLGALDINLFGKFRRFRKHRHSLLQNFREATNDREVHFLFAAGAAVAQFPNPELSDQRRVARQNAKFTFGARQHSLSHALAQQLALRRDDDQLDGLRKHLGVYALAFIFSAFAKASSIVPTM